MYKYMSCHGRRIAFVNNPESTCFVVTSAQTASPGGNQLLSENYNVRQDYETQAPQICGGVRVLRGPGHCLLKLISSHIDTL